LHCVEDEPDGPDIPKDEFDFEKNYLTSEDLRQEILRYEIVDMI